MVDQIKVTETLAQLDKEFKNSEPYVLGLPGNKRIVFEDFMNWEGERAKRAEKLMEAVTGDNDMSIDAIAKLWLSDKDYKTWQAQRLSLRQKAQIVRKASQRILNWLTQGESDASANS